ncbi:MAG: efflux RND transporter periplasmic adaptor subunit [Deltaproteobacteria bacterium]|nr:efflux RND transporter periplasmic adaptor subunit [Deltaproteobacteria bacterium]
MMTRSNDTLKRLLLHVGLAITLGLFLSCSDKDENPGVRAHGVAPQKQAKQVRIQSVKAVASQKHIEQVGTLCAHLKVKVVSELGGTIEKLSFERGDRVRKGQVLAEISTSSIRIEVAQAKATVAVAESHKKKTQKGSRPEEISIAMARVVQAEAALQEAENNFRRIQSLHGRNAISNSDFDTAKKGVDTARANLDSTELELELARKGPRIEDREAAKASLQQARAALALARDRLRKSILRSPCDGIVAFRTLEEREVVGPGTTITQIVDREKMKIKLSLGERYVSILERERRFPFLIDAIPGEEFEARLTFVSPTADPFTHSFPLELSVVDPDPKMADGMTVRVAFPLVNPRKSVKVPSAWLAEEKGVIGLFVVKEGRAVFRKVALGSYYAHTVEILSGVRENELVITNPSGLKSGDQVQYEGAAPSIR